MSDKLEAMDRKEILKQAFLKIEELQGRLKKAEQQKHEPIAIIGAGCRLPGGAYDLDSFWRVLRDGVDTVGEIPADRWDADSYFDPDPDATGKMYTRHGAFLDQVDRFDAHFFRIAPREAAHLDPQQRLLLEVAWEAIEKAGQAPEQIAGTATGVFIGMTANDYPLLQSRTTSMDYIDTYFGTGSAISIAAGRISYLLGLRGPCMTVDTACSSSLVAVHLACRSLRSGESTMALAGGVSLILAPESHIIACKGQMLSRDGRCKTFDAAADGYGRGEGCGIVLLKRLSEARADGDPILGLILGSAVNQDGRSAGLTAPNGIAQEEVMRKALIDARVTAAEVSYIEAHGTGTVLGDPIEIQALEEVYGAGHSRENPLLVGSVKTNVGHLEAAAGIAGLIKVLLAMQYGDIPPHLHVNQLNPYIPWDTLAIDVVTRRTPWPKRAQRRIAGLSSFGFSGTNVHVILEGAIPEEKDVKTDTRPLHILTLSAKTPMALNELAERYGRHLDQRPSDSIGDVCYTANAGRSHFHCRLAVIGKTSEDMREGLRSFEEGRPAAASVFHGELSSKNPPPVAFLFTGQGSQTVGMGRVLYETQPVFRKALNFCHEALQSYLAKPLLDVLYPAFGKEREEQDLLNQTAFTQPALFALEYALTELWKSWGIEPSVVMGHSVGEYVAACVAGVFSLEDGLRLIAERGRLMQSLPRGGAMAAVFADAAKVAAMVSPFDNSISIAAINSPENTVITGPESDLATVIERLEEAGIGSQKLLVSHAFHSCLVEPIFEDFNKIAATIRFSKPRIDIVSNMSGRVVDGDEIAGPAYWCRHAREPVNFLQSMHTLYEQGYRLFLEVGPHPTLLGMGGQCLPESDCVWVPSLRRGLDDWDQMLKALGRLYVNGVWVKWRRFEQDGMRRRLPLPTYPFQREHHWVEPPKGDISPAAYWDPKLHPLLGRRMSFAKSNDIVFESILDTNRTPFVKDHRFFNAVIVPATAYLEMGLAAAVTIAREGPHCIEDFNIHSPLVIADGARPILQTIVSPAGKNEAGFEIYSRSDDDPAMGNEWKLHADGTLKLDRTNEQKTCGETWPAFQKQTQARCAETLSGAGYYEMLRSKGLDYGPAFQCLEDIHRGDGEAVGRIHVPDILQSECQSYHVHPALLDACLHLLGVALLGREGVDDSGHVYMPMGLERYSFHKHGLENGWIHGTIRSGDNADNETFVGDVKVFNSEGGPIAHLEGLRFKRAARETLQRDKLNYIAEWLHELHWQDLEPLSEDKVAQPSSQKLLIFADRHGVGEGLSDHLKKIGKVSILVRSGSDPDGCSDGSFTVNPGRREDFERLFRDITAAGQSALDGIVYLQSLNVETPDLIASTREEHPELDCISVLHLVQSMARVSWASPPHLTLVTRGAATVDSQVDAVQPGQGAIWGLGRVIAAEHPEFRCKLVDLDPMAGSDEKIISLAGEILENDRRENQVALRQGRRLALHLVRSRRHTQPNEARLGLHASGSYQLEIPSRGVLDNLELRPTTVAPPEPGEVQIKVEATGLNFRDVLNALDMYPGDPGALGNECVGRIAALGEGVQGFEIGDPVLALTSRAFCSHVNVKAELVAARPDEMSVEEAATIPMTFLTAHYALHNLGRMNAGERVLIHAGAGGVGMAAIQLAQQAGVEIYATAGSQEKRALLKTLGVPHVMDSRTLAFADQIMEATSGQGIDIVLNSLAGDFIPKSLMLLREGGRFLELGKTDMWDQERAEKVNPAVSFIPVFLGDICRERPTHVQSMFQDVMQSFRDGRLKPLPYSVFPIDDIRSAFRFMAQAKHIGKVVVDQRRTTADPLIRVDAVYLITGGLGALGLHFAGWLAEKGARHLVLLGRRPAGETALEVIGRLQASGVSVAVMQGDVSIRKDLQRVLAGIAAMPPLKGIIHAAGLVDDGMLRNQNRERFIKVMAPKIKGSWLLHTLTQNSGLDFFVMCSAGAALFGSPGQGNYAAANAFMDALASYRRSFGLPALSINWGPWAKGGMAAALAPRDHQRWASMGMGTIEPVEGLTALEMALEKDTPQVAVLPINWPIFFRQFPPGEEPPFLSEIARSERAHAQVGTGTAQTKEFLERLKQADPEDRHGILMDHVRELIVSVLGLQPFTVLRRDEGLTDLGMDSLMAVELSNRLKRTLNRPLPSTLAFEYPSIRALTDHLASEVLGLETNRSAMNASGPAASDQVRMRESVEHLDDVAVAAMLTQELDSAGY